MKTLGTQCPISTHPAEKITFACYACLCFRSVVTIGTLLSHLQKIADRQGQAYTDREPGTDLIAPRVTAPSCIWNVQMAKLR